MSEGSFTWLVNPTAFARLVLEQIHGPEALMVERPVETRQEEIRALLGPHHADVAQSEEARRSERRECRFESDRQYQLDVAQLEAHRLREPGVGSSNLSVQTNDARWCNRQHTWL